MRRWMYTYQMNTFVMLFTMALQAAAATVGLRQISLAPDKPWKYFLAPFMDSMMI